MATLIDSVAGRATVAVRLEADHPFGAYQGTLHYDVGALRVTRVTTSAEGHRVVNAPAGGEQGRVIFAGFAVDSIAPGAVAMIDFDVRDWAALAQLDVRLDVIADRQGARVSSRQVVGVRGVH